MDVLVREEQEPADRGEAEVRRRGPRRRPARKSLASGIGTPAPLDAEALMATLLESCRALGEVTLRASLAGHFAYPGVRIVARWEEDFGTASLMADWDFSDPDLDRSVSFALTPREALRIMAAVRPGSVGLEGPLGESLALGSASAGRRHAGPRRIGSAARPHGGRR